MKVKVGDSVVPSYILGRVVEVTDKKVVIEIKDHKNGGVRYTELNESHAALRGTDLESLVEESLVVIHAKD